MKELDPFALVFLDLWHRLRVAGTLNSLVTASVFLEETVQGKRIPYLIWRGLAVFLTYGMSHFKRKPRLA